MKPATSDEVLDLLDTSFTSAALGAALELGLFWLLEERPRDADQIARALGIPTRRCAYWLHLLARTGLIEETAEGFAPSHNARTAILKTYGRDTWALLAEEARQRLPGLADLSRHITEPGSAWAALGLTPPMYLTAMARDAEAARRFVRMLYELHGPRADQLARVLDLAGVSSLMDLGGGSGVMSMALVRRYPRLATVIVDLANVCAAARELVVENVLEDRISYHPADFLRDDLPSGFDLVLECDVNVYSEALFRKVRTALNPQGRFVIVDQLAPESGTAPPSRLHWAFQGSMIDPEFHFPTAAELQAQLKIAGFRNVSHRTLPPVHDEAERFTRGTVLIEAS